MQNIINFFQNNIAARIILDAYLSLLIISFLVFLAFKIKKVFVLLVIGILLGFCTYLAEEIGLTISGYLYPMIFGTYFVFVAVIATPEIRSLMDTNKNMDSRVDFSASSNETTKEAIADAVFNLSSTKVGALITIELHNIIATLVIKHFNKNNNISLNLWQKEH